MNPDVARQTCEADAEEMPDDDDDEGEEGEEGEDGEEVAAPPRELESLRARRVAEGGGEEFRVRWVGRTWEDDTWEPRAAIADMVADVEEHISKLDAMEAAQRQMQDKHAGKSAGKKKGAMFVRL